MLKAKNIKSGGKYPLLAVLIFQLALTSLFCATSGYAANSIMLCTPFGFKTIQIDENGQKVPDNGSHAEFQKQCFHCSAGCGGLAILSDAPLSALNIQLATYSAAPQDQAFRSHRTRGPPSRGPPLA
jgi:hypothetical protein